MQYNIGDRVTILAIKNSNGSLDLLFVMERDEHEGVQEHNCLIVGIDPNDSDDIIILCDFDPHSYFSFKIDLDIMSSHNIHSKFLNNKAAHIRPAMIWKDQPKETIQIHNLDPGGMACAICNNFVQYAAENLPNGVFICWNCKQTKNYLVRSFLKQNDIDSD